MPFVSQDVAMMGLKHGVSNLSAQTLGLDFIIIRAMVLGRGTYGRWALIFLSLVSDFGHSRTFLVSDLVGLLMGSIQHASI